MAFIWNVDNIRKLSKDNLTYSRARGIYYANKWQSLGGNERLIWGYYPIRENYRVLSVVDLTGPHLFCSCRTKIKPCKHALALLLQLEQRSDSFFITQEVPEDVIAMQSSHNASKKQRRSAHELEADIQHQRNEAKRMELMQAGVKQLENYLKDVVKIGLSNVVEGNTLILENLALQMTDAKMGGIAKKIRMYLQLPDEINKEQELISLIGQLYLFARSFKKINFQEPHRATFLKGYAGWHQKKEELLLQSGLKDNWIVLGIKEGVEENLRYRKVWIQGLSSGRYAYLLDYSWGGQPYERSYHFLNVFESELVYYPGKAVFRALPKSYQISKQQPQKLAGFSNFAVLLDNYAQSIAANPWLYSLPALLGRLVPFEKDSIYYLSDQDGNVLHLNVDEGTFWKLMAISGGHPIPIFGEWDGKAFLPLSTKDGKRWILL